MRRLQIGHVVELFPWISFNPRMKEGRKIEKKRKETKRKEKKRKTNKKENTIEKRTYSKIKERKQGGEEGRKKERRKNKKKRSKEEKEFEAQPVNSTHGLIQAGFFWGHSYSLRCQRFCRSLAVQKFFF